jgi:hypothetical protein
VAIHQQRRTVQVLLLQLVLPQRLERNVGVFLLDEASGNLYFRLRDKWDDIASPEDVEILSELGDDFRKRIVEMGERGGEKFLQSLEDTLSHVLQLTSRQPMQVTDLQTALDRLYKDNCG